MDGLALLALLSLLAAAVGSIALHRIAARGQLELDSAKRRPGKQQPVTTGSHGELLPEGSAESDRLLAAEEAATKNLPRGADLPYTKQRYLLTQAEREFFAVLKAAVPEGWHVFPQVRLANLVMVHKGVRNWKPHFSRVAQKCVDFVICDEAAIEPRLVVELDDSSHDRPDRQKRDAFVDAALSSAGLPILHVRYQRRYDTEHLARQIREAAGLKAQPVLRHSQTPRPATATPVSAYQGAKPSQSARPISSTEHAGAATPKATRLACRRCGAEVSSTAKFCMGCGATLEL